MPGVLKKKRPFFYGLASFPYEDSVLLDSVHQEAHFVLNSDELRTGFISLGDVNQSNDKANAKIALISFVSKSIQHGLNYRGFHAGSTYSGENARVVVLLNYLTHELWESKELHIPLGAEQTFRSENILGVLVSIFIIDDSLSFSDILSDMMKINVFGLPQRRMREFANQPEERFRPRPPADAAGAQEAVVGRPDIPGKHLDADNTAYKFVMMPDQADRMRAKRKIVSKYYTNIDRISKLVSLMQTARGGNYGRVPQSDSIQHLFTLGLDHAYQLNNFFTLDRAIEQIKLMAVDPIFQSKDSWVNTFRAANGASTFGAPCWKAGERASYEAGILKTCASLPLDMFRPSGIFFSHLPHVSMLRAEMNFDAHAQIDIDEATGRKVNISHMMEALGMPSAPRSIQLANEAGMNKDPFNAIADKNNEIETKLRDRAASGGVNSAEYKTMLRNHREEGYRQYSALLGDIAAPDLPETYSKGLLLWRWQNANSAPSEEHLWQSPSVSMCSYAQIKVQQLKMFEDIMGTSDSQLYLLPVMLRAAYGVYIGRYGSKNFREHIQVVSAPGAGKSNLIERLVLLLIPGTFEVQGGASGMGLIGKHVSERKIELYHEMDGHFAPVREPEGEDAKIHKMLLGCLSEGFKKYKTTGEVVDPITGIKGRQPIMQVSEDTNVRMGNRNHIELHAKPGGSAAAMHDRFTILLMTLLFSENRPGMLPAVLNIQYGSTSEAMISVQKQFHMMQDLFARFHAGMSIGYMPRADFSLYNSLNAMMTAFVATRYPNFLNALRCASTMNGRIITETGMHAAWLTLFTPLNPTAKVQKFEKAELELLQAQAQQYGYPPERVRPYTLKFGTYNPDVLLPVMAKLYYTRYEALVFVFSEKLFEMTNVVLLDITRHIAERNSKYHVYNLSTTLEESNKPWPPATANQTRNGMDRPDQMPLDLFLSELMNEDRAIYHLGLPASMRQTNARKQDAHGDNGVGDFAYNSFELLPETVKPEYLKLYQTMVCNEGLPFRITRNEKPVYKKEYLNGTRFINMNYVCIQTSIEEYARSASGIFGHYKVDEKGFVAMMKGLTKEFMVTPYLPLIEELGVTQTRRQTQNNNNDPAGPAPPAQPPAARMDWMGVLDRIQSLRYMHHFSKFPMFRVPVLIEHETKNCFYLLVSYFETDPYKICTEAINHISYHKTPHRKMILGVPSRDNHFIYEPFTLKPRVDVELRIPGKFADSEGETSPWINSKYAFDSATGRAPLGSKVDRSEQVHRDVCIEKLYAEKYLSKNFPKGTPGSSETLLEDWGPDGVERRLREFYIEHPECLERIPYPACIANPERPVSDGKPLAAPDLMPAPEKRAAGASPSSQSLRVVEGHRSAEEVRRASKKARDTVGGDRSLLEGASMRTSRLPEIGSL